MNELLVSEPDGGVVTLTMNRPEKRNALSAGLRLAICDALDAAATDERVNAVVLTGAGPVFSAGFDLAEMKAAASRTPAEQAESMELADRFHLGVLRFPLPIIASVNGPAVGGGFDLAILTDLRVAAGTATFSHPEQAWGDVIYRPLRDLVGGAAARELALTGRTIDAAEAFRLGLLTRVVEPGALAEAAADLAATVARAPRDVLLRMKAKIIDAAAIPPAARTLDL